MRARVAFQSQGWVQWGRRRGRDTELQMIWLPTARRAIDLHSTLNILADSPRGVQMKGNVVNSL